MGNQALSSGRNDSVLAMSQLYAVDDTKSESQSMRNIVASLATAQSQKTVATMKSETKAEFRAAELLDSMSTSACVRAVLPGRHPGPVWASVLRVWWDFDHVRMQPWCFPGCARSDQDSQISYSWTAEAGFLAQRHPHVATWHRTPPAGTGGSGHSFFWHCRGRAHAALLPIA